MTVFAPLSVIVFCTGMGTFFFMLALSVHREFKGCEDWLTVSGRVVSATVRKGLRYEGSDNGGVRAVARYQPVIEYAYEVSGKTYVGTRIRLGRTRFSESQAQGVVDRYPRGSTVEVYYNPDDPAMAVLEREAAGSGVLRTLGAVFIAVAVLGGLLTLIPTLVG